MPLTATQRKFLVDNLKILTGWAASCFKDPLNAHVDAYLRDEAEVIAAIEKLKAMGCSREVINAREHDVEGVQAMARGATRKNGSDTLEEACHRLLLIQRRVLESQLEVGEFHEALRETQHRIGMQSAEIADRIHTQYMEMISRKAREGRYQEALAILLAANQALDEIVSKQAALDAARGAARTAFDEARGLMTGLERDEAGTMLQKANAAAAAGDDARALDLYAQSRQYCQISSAARLEVRTTPDGRSLKAALEPLSRLKTHRHAGEATDLIRGLMWQLNSVRQRIATHGEGAPPESELSEIFSIGETATGVLKSLNARDDYFDRRAAARRCLREMREATKSSAIPEMVQKEAEFQAAMDQAHAFAEGAEYLWAIDKLQIVILGSPRVAPDFAHQYRSSLNALWEMVRRVEQDVSPSMLANQLRAIALMIEGAIEAIRTAPFEIDRAALVLEKAQSEFEEALDSAVGRREFGDPQQLKEAFQVRFGRQVPPVASDGEVMRTLRAFYARTASLDRLQRERAGFGGPPQVLTRLAGGKVAALNQLIGEIGTALAEVPADFAPLDSKLLQAQALCTALSALDLLTTAEAPPERVDAQLKTLVEMPGGEKILDEAIPNLRPTDSSLHLPRVIRARFQIVFTDAAVDPRERMGIREAQGIFGAMILVPRRHINHPMLVKVTRNPDGESYYNDVMTITIGGGYVTAMQTMSVGSDPGDLPTHRICDPRELPDVPAVWKPLPTAKTTKLAWDTAHEVGHAADAKLGFMETRVDVDPRFGEWKRHFDLNEVGDALARGLKLREITGEMITAYIRNQTQPMPPPPGWPEAKRCVDRIRADQNPWEKGELCRNTVDREGCVVEGRAIHEGYPGQWYSYDAKLRERGIRAYQFRATGEWLAELYAAAVLGILPDGHPDWIWLKELLHREAA